MRRLAVLAVLLVAAPTQAGSDDTELNRATIVYARGAALYKSDGRGKDEAELVALPAGTTGSAVRALRTDARGTILLADIGGKWFWMKLAGGKSLVELPCGDGPAQLDVDATSVFCKSKQQDSVIVNLATGKPTPVPVPAHGRLAGAGAARKLVWADGDGIWSAPPGDLKKKVKVARQAPLRGFLPSPDGTHAVGTYPDFKYDGKVKVPTDILMGFALDGEGARRKGIRNGVPIEWSHDNQWVLVQDGSSACLMRINGGQYKCWKGFTAVSIAPDGSYALVLGNRDGNKSSSKTPPAKAPAKEPTGDEQPAAIDDVPVPPPSGPLALYRAMLATPNDVPPAMIARVVDGAAAWIPGR
jgi:hypothetical protein